MVRFAGSPRRWVGGSGIEASSREQQTPITPDGAQRRSAIRLDRHIPESPADAEVPPEPGDALVDDASLAMRRPAEVRIGVMPGVLLALVRDGRLYPLPLQPVPHMRHAVRRAVFAAWSACRCVGGGRAPSGRPPPRSPAGPAASMHASGRPSLRSPAEFPGRQQPDEGSIHRRLRRGRAPGRPVRPDAGGDLFVGGDRVVSSVPTFVSRFWLSGGSEVLTGSGWRYVSCPLHLAPAGV